MIGGLITSAFLTLEIIPVIYTYWRQEQVLWERLEPLDPRRLKRLQIATYVQATGWATLAALFVTTLYVVVPRGVFISAVAAGAAAALGGLAVYLTARPGARRQVWPATS
jgi:Cu(I)/Ag(I) efflux system membrane protein CusA/SilA